VESRGSSRSGAEGAAVPTRRIRLWPAAAPAFALAVCVALGAAAIGSRMRGTRSDGATTTSDCDVPYRLPLVPGPDPDREVAFYKERLKLDPASGLNRVHLAQAYLSLGRATSDPKWYAMAEESARASLARLPAPSPAALLVLARCAEARHDFAEAVKLAERVLAARPADADALAALASAKLARGELQAAAELSGRVVARSPSPAVYALRAAVRAALGQVAASRADLARAIALEEPGELESAARTRIALARLHLRDGAPGCAERVLIEALRIRPGFHAALAARGDTALALGRPGEAERHFLAAHARSADPLYLAGAARARAAGGDDVGARTLCGRAIADLEAQLAVGFAGHRRDLAALLLDRSAPGDAARALALATQEERVRRDAATLEVLARARARAAADPAGGVARSPAPGGVGDSPSRRQ
jgi:tetratricopeptide (TPR) repeat protein